MGVGGAEGLEGGGGGGVAAALGDGVGKDIIGMGVGEAGGVRL